MQTVILLLIIMYEPAKNSFAGIKIPPKSVAKKVNRKCFFLIATLTHLKLRAFSYNYLIHL
jgi:hypothetical protein